MNPSKYVPERTCAACFKKSPQKEFTAVKRLKDGSIMVDLDQKLAGRGVYLCKNSACLMRARKRKGKNALAYSLKTEIPQHIWEELEKFYSTLK
jgi:predicted RNA-binding protein YlxR (DUF448 family)